jgi:hypothetical protein
VVFFVGLIFPKAFTVYSLMVALASLAVGLLLRKGSSRLRRQFRTFAYFKFRVMYMREHLPKVAHIHERPADRAISEMIGLGFGGAVCVDTI